MLLRLALLVPLLGLAGLGPAHPPPDPEPLRTAGDRPIDIRHIRLDLAIDLPRQTIKARATLSVQALRDLKAFSLDAVDFEVRSVTLQRADRREADVVRFRHDGKHLIVEPGDLATGTAATLTIDYVVREPKDGLFFFGPTQAEPDVPLTVWSQGEAITNRFWIPCLDHPDQKQSSELVATVPDGFEVLSNGRLVERKANADKTVTFHWKQEKPHVSYLITLVVGQFDIVKEDSNGLELSYYVPKGRQPDVSRTFGRTRAMLEFFSRRFGIDYPWEKYAQVVVEQFSGGGMENTSATTLTDRALHDERAFLDSNADRLIAHELGHQWWGDLITCRDWAHLWLNEGFATFCEVIWAEHHEGAEEGAYALVQKARSAIAGGKDRPIVDRRYQSPRLMFDARAYPKGAWVLQMLRHQLGEKTFWKAIQAYGREHQYKSVETADLRRTLERVSGRNLERFFYDWTERPGAPVLEIASEYLPDDKTMRVRVKQTQPGEAFHFPLRIACGRGSGSAPVIVDGLIREKSHTFHIPLEAAPTLVIVDPDLAVLAEIKEKKGRDLWEAQLLHASSVAARIRAAEYFGQSKRPRDREVLAQALKTEKFWAVAAEIAQALGQTGGDVARDALIAGLNHPQAKVRRACADELGKFPRDVQVTASLKERLKKGDASYFVEAALVAAYAKVQPADAADAMLPWLVKPSHNEVLRSAALTGLGESGQASALEPLVTWTKRGKPRAARAAALSGLARLSQTARLTDEQRSRLVAAIADCLENETAPIRRAAATAMRDLGRDALAKLDVLQAMARHDPDPRIGELARQAADKIRANSPMPEEIQRLREELDKLRQTNEALRERLERLERK